MGGLTSSSIHDEPAAEKLEMADMQDYESVARATEGELDGDDDEEEALARSSSKGSLASRKRPLYQTSLGGSHPFYLRLFIGVLLLGSIALGLYKYTLCRDAKCTLTSGSQDNPTHYAATDDYAVTYNPTVSSLKWNPFDLQATDLHKASLLSPSPFGPDYGVHSSNSPQEPSAVMGYIMEPDIVNGTAVFIAEGDLYWTRVLDPVTGTPLVAPSAIRLTFTIGNVRTPKINPVYPYLIAFTATYQARREVYLLDLRKTGSASGNKPAQRLTYFDSAAGVNSVASWSPDGATIVFASTPNQVGLRDVRLYEMALEQNPGRDSPIGTNSSSSSYALQVGQVRPVPLAQATEGVYADADSSSSNCLYFVRYKQPSYTARYVGGTAESLWAYCEGAARAIHLTADYTGTSKNPSVLTVHGRKFLLFLSDRSPMDQPTGPAVFQSGKWRATSMNLWAAPLPTAKELYAEHFVLKHAVQLTRVSCQFDGMALQEYSADPVTGNVLLRIGADLHYLSASQVRAALLEGTTALKHSAAVPLKLPIQVTSDFHEQQERLIKVGALKDMTSVDIFETNFGTTYLLLTLRGQVWVAPVLKDKKDLSTYQGAGQNIPERRYRVVPGAMTGGSIRVLTALNVPLYAAAADSNRRRRLALILATDPLSRTAEHAFYMVEVQADSVNSFVDLAHFPDPFVGGHVNGGSTKDGGLGSIDPSNVVVSPCGRRFAWTDTDDRICVMSMPIYVNNSTDGGSYGFQCLPRSNDNGEPMAGTLSTLSWSPGGRYLGVEHNALNQFSVLSIVDCGDPEAGESHMVCDIKIGQISQVTPSRFNSYGMYWGKSTFDFFLSSLVKMLGAHAPDDVATTLFFISDRDIISDVNSPWGSRAPLPHFSSQEGHVYALPLTPKLNDVEKVEQLTGRFSGGGTMEVYSIDLDVNKVISSAVEPTDEGDSRRNLKTVLSAKLARSLKGRRLNEEDSISVARYLKASDASIPSSSNTTITSPFPKDADLHLPTNDLSFARFAHRMASIPRGKFSTIVSQTQDDGSFVLIDKGKDDSPAHVAVLFSANPFPSDVLDVKVLSRVHSWGLSSSRKHVYFVSSSGDTTVVGNTAADISGFGKDSTWSQNQANTDNMAISVWPALEYRQMYGDAWRLMRDYFYDANLHNVDWKAAFDRYEPLVQRCGKREELDDVFAQMASETSALHSFVYGGEYNSPEAPPLAPASLGASLKRAPEWKGYMITEIPEQDPDYNLIDGKAQYCPVSDKALRPTGQKGLKVGDIIVAVNGESVMLVPDIHMMLRGTAGETVRLEVLRLQSGNYNDTESVTPESVIVVPITPLHADFLRYSAWEWRSRESAKELARKAGFSVGYIHIRAMDRDGEDAFARGYFPDHDKDALIIDVRHNTGGNIDSWILGMLQRKAWMYWAGRGDKRFGNLDWDEQFAFRGKVVVLIDERTASNGEGLARGISELGLGKLIGTRTWGGGIWGSSANTLVDGGIAAAPQWGTFNERLGWGGGVEMTGVGPDIEVVNDPHMTFHERDVQLETAILELKNWLEKEPVPAFHTPAGSRPDMSLHNDDCPA